MFDLIRTHQLNIMLCLCAVCVMIAILLAFTKFLPIRRKMWLIYMEICATFLLYFDRLAYVYSGDTSGTGYIMVRVSNFAVFFLTSAVVFIFNGYLRESVFSDMNLKSLPKRLIAVSGVSVLGMLLSVISAFTGLYYYFDGMNRYHRGPGFLLCYIVPVLCPIIQYTCIFEFRKKIRHYIYIALTLYIFMPIAVGILQIFTYGLSIVNMAMVVVSILLYIFTYLDVNEEVVRVHKLEMKNLIEERKTMKHLFDQTARAFMHALDSRDEYTVGRSEKLADISRMIAKESGFDEKKCDEVYYAALLSDIGMVTMPDSVYEDTESPDDDDQQLIRKKPVFSADILAAIKEYPYLSETARYVNERYDGSGYPEGLSGRDIPDYARVIAVADAYVKFASVGKNHNPLPAPIIREEFLKNAGTVYDPDYSAALVAMLDSGKIMPIAGVDDNKASELENEIICEDYREHVSTGVRLRNNMIRVTFKCELETGDRADFSMPSLILFDSYDRRVHSNPQTVEDYHYIEYGEIWFDGHFISTDARAMQRNAVITLEESIPEAEYVVTAIRYEDHVKVYTEFGDDKHEYTVVLPDRSKAFYIGLTGEHCRLYDISVKPVRDSREDDIEKIAEEIGYIDRIESDLPNVQIDRPMSASTAGIRVDDRLHLEFHSMSLPSSSLVWHCPYIILYYSDDEKVNGKGYTEYAVVKLNGEITSDDSLCSNTFEMKKKSNFPGWNEWKKYNKKGLEYSVEFVKKGNKLTLLTDTLGISIENVTTVKSGKGNIYVAISGDQVAITDIRIG